MRKYIENKIYSYTREDRYLINKNKLARRLNCDPRTVNRYLKIQSGEIVPKKSNRIYKSVLDDYKTTIINKVDIYGATAIAAYKFIQKKSYSDKYSIVAAFVKTHKNE